MNSLIISNMNVRHLYSIKDILISDFDDFWTFSVFKSELENENSNYLVAEIR